jgi:hypothetical protein
MKVCGQSYVTEGIPDDRAGYDGSPLLQCSRCKMIWYQDRDAQKAHWKKHKQSCSVVSDEEQARIASLTLDASFASLKNSLLSLRPGGPEAYHIIRRIQQLIEEGDPGAGDMGMELHTFARGIIFHPQNVMRDILARPGMVQLLLADDDALLHHKTQLLKELGPQYNGKNPTDSYIQLQIPDETERNRVQNLSDLIFKLESSFSFSEPSSMTFCYLYFNLIVAAAIQARTSHSSINDGDGVIRGSDQPDDHPNYMLATAALRRAFTLWTDPLVNASCGDAMAPAASLVLTAIQLYNSRRNLGGAPFCREHELVPGLAVDAVVITCLNELNELSASGPNSASILTVLAEMSLKSTEWWKSTTTTTMDEVGQQQQQQQQPMWKNLPVERRAKVALAIVRYIRDADDDDNNNNYGPKKVPVLVDACNTLFNTVCGMTNNPCCNTMDLCKSVWERAAADELLGPEGAGKNYSSRAFFHFSLRRRGDPSKWKDAVAKMKEFEKIPSLLRDSDNELAKEKEECFKLARGEKEHARVLEQLAKMMEFNRN